MEVNPSLAEHMGEGISWHVTMRYANQMPTPVTVPGILP